MISITRKSDGKAFDLPLNLTLSIEESSPLFSEQGSFSLPIELPMTARNKELLDYPYRIDRVEQFILSVEVVVTAGVWIRHAMMRVESVQSTRTVQASLYFSESVFYQKIRSVTLPEVFSTYVRNRWAGEISALVGYMNSVMCGDIEDDFYIFPVCAIVEDYTQSESMISNGGLEAGQLKQTQTLYTILNKVRVPTADTPVQPLTSQRGEVYYPLDKDRSDKLPGAPMIELPPAYGIAPFLKFTFVLRKVFEYFGYQLVESDFDREESFKRMCIVHNVADACVRGILDYSQLVPDMTVVDFLALVETFGVKFVVNEFDKTITPIFWKNVLRIQQAKGIKYEDDKQLVYASPRSVKITFDVVSDYENRTRKLAEAQQKNGVILEKYASYADLFTAMTTGSITDGLYYTLKDQGIWAVQKSTSDKPLPVAVAIGDYSTNVSAEVEEYSMPFGYYKTDSVPMRGRSRLEYNYESTHGRNDPLLNEVEDWIVKEVIAINTDEEGIIAPMMIIDSINHINTVKETVTTESEGESTVKTENDTNESNMFLLAFSTGWCSVGQGGVYVGRQQIISPNSNTLGSFDMTALSIYMYGWREYDRCLQTSMHTITGRVTLSEPEILSLSYQHPVLVDGQLCLVERMQYDITDKGINLTEMTVRIIKHYE